MLSPAALPLLQTLWFALLVLLVLVWDLRFMGLGFCLAALSFVYILTRALEPQVSHFAGIALAPALGALAFSLGFLRFPATGHAALRPTVTLRGLIAAAMALGVGFAPLHRLAPFLPDLLQAPGMARMALYLTATGFAFLSLADNAAFFGFGLLWLALAGNAVVFSAYPDAVALLYLANVLQLLALLLLARQALRVSMWLAWQQTAADG